MKPDDFNDWTMYKFIFVIWINGSCSYGFLEKAMKLNLDMMLLEDVDKLYWKIANI